VRWASQGLPAKLGFSKRAPTETFDSPPSSDAHQAAQGPLGNEGLGHVVDYLRRCISCRTRSPCPHDQ
jgi:hypothetical protein